MPTYFRIMDDPIKRNVVHKQLNGEPSNMVQIVSKNQGWITVNPQVMDRTRPIEKMRLGDASKVNMLSPNWMQLTHKKPDHDPLFPIGVKHGVRQENNRLFLVEKSQPQRSMFSLGSMRHNVQSVEMRNHSLTQALKTGNVTQKAARLIEWKEPLMERQKYDKPVSPKIGSFHFQ
mmetsp:Transcript_6072/g.10304  ORF Transcript_6072/g.10304 Transcript_6072/m.10304 type:complete len:175 (-) Transcript_6072:32-556(-)